MSYSASFLDNQILGVEDFNGILSALVKKGGVCDISFARDVPYTVQKMNEVTAAGVASAGVVPTAEAALRCTVNGNKIQINIGNAVFRCGVVLRVTAAETLPRTAGAAQYVYLKYSQSENRAYPMASPTALYAAAGEELIALCEISAEGTLTDKRTYAVGTLAAAANWNGTEKRVFTYTKTAGTNGNREYEDRVLELNGDRINFLLFHREKNMALVLEPEYGKFEVYSWYLGRYNGVYITLEDSASQGRETALRQFSRGEDGKVHYLLYSDFDGAYTLYASTYSETN